MWTSTLDLSLNRVLLARLLSLAYPNIYYSLLSPLHVANIPRPTLPAANWVRVRNRLAGICESDLRLVHTNVDMRTSVATLANYKHIYPGHEVVGEVIEIGEGVQHLRVGDRVVLQYTPNCLSNGAKPVCRACTAGSYNLCEYGPLPGPQPIGGGWSEEMLLHEQQLFRLPNELSDEQGVILEPTAVALHAVLRHLPQPNDNVLIIGAGTIGSLTLQILHALVPKAQISILTRYPFQIEHATRLGADHIIYPMDPYASVQRATHSQLSQGILNNRTLLGGYDVIYDTVGQQKTVHHALRWLRAHGTMVLVGLSLHMMHIDLTPVWHQEINLLGSPSHGRETWPLGTPTSILGTPAGPSTFSVVTELIQQKLIQPEELITHRFALNNYKAALLAAKQKKRSQSIKVLFDYALLPASAVPNLRASARPHRPALSQPHGDAFMEEFLKIQGVTGPLQGPEHEAIPQSNIAQRTLAPKILDTPPLQARTKEAWQSGQDIEQDDTDEDTDPAIPAITRRSYNPAISSRFPVTPLPIEPTPALTIETLETHTDEPEVSPISVQPTLEPQEAEAASILSTPTDHTLLEGPAELPTNETEPTPALTIETLETHTDEPEVSPISAQPTLEPQEAEAASTLSTPTDHTLLEVQTELSANEEEPATPFPETIGINVLTEEQLPTQTVLDHLFDADASSIPAFLAQLSNFSELTTPEMPIEDAEAPILTDTSATALPIEDVEAPLAPDTSATSLPIEDAEAPILTDTSATTLPIEDVEVPLAPDTSLPIEDAEAPILTDTSVTPLPIDSSDQVEGDQTHIIPANSQPEAKKKRKTSKTEDELIQEAQPEQVATPAAQEPTAIDSDQKTPE
jgi:threonine dehydrogenase-like Zn-dependent dehydrogenase